MGKYLGCSGLLLLYSSLPLALLPMFSTSFFSAFVYITFSLVMPPSLPLFHLLHSVPSLIITHDHFSLTL